MKIIIIGLFAMLSAGCSPTITNGHVTRALEICKDHGGISQISAPTVFALVDLTKIFAVECVDGTYKRIGETK